MVYVRTGDGRNFLIKNLVLPIMFGSPLILYGYKEKVESVMENQLKRERDCQKHPGMSCPPSELYEMTE